MKVFHFSSHADMLPSGSGRERGSEDSNDVFKFFLFLYSVFASGILQLSFFGTYTFKIVSS